VIAVKCIAGVEFPARAWIFCLVSFQRVSGTHQTSYPTFSPRFLKVVKQLRLEAHHSTQSSIQVKNDGAMPSFPYISSWRGV
jgi:hypothetical protein